MFPSNATPSPPPANLYQELTPFAPPTSGNRPVSEWFSGYQLQPSTVGMEPVTEYSYENSHPSGVVLEELSPAPPMFGNRPASEWFSQPSTVGMEPVAEYSDENSPPSYAVLEELSSAPPMPGNRPATEWFSGYQQQPSTVGMEPVAEYSDENRPPSFAVLEELSSAPPMSRKRPATEWHTGDYKRGMTNGIAPATGYHNMPFSQMGYASENQMMPAPPTNDTNFGQSPYQPNYSRSMLPTNSEYGMPQAQQFQNHNAVGNPIHQIPDDRFHHQETLKVSKSESENRSHSAHTPRPVPRPVHSQCKAVIAPTEPRAQTSKRKSKGSAASIVQCLVCPPETAKRLNGNHMYHLTNHLAFHDHQLKRFECPTCGFSSMRFDKIEAHVVKTVGCDVSQCTMKANPDYYNRMSLSVKQCFPSLHDRIMEYVKQERVDQQRVRRRPLTRVRTAECQKCGGSVRTNGGSRTYHAKTHSELCRYHCSACGKAGHLKDNLIVHVANAHGGDAEIEDRESPEMKEEYKRLYDECFPQD